MQWFRPDNPELARQETRGMNTDLFLLPLSLLLLVPPTSGTTESQRGREPVDGPTAVILLRTQRGEGRQGADTVGYRRTPSAIMKWLQHLGVINQSTDTQHLSEHDTVHRALSDKT